MISVSKLSKKYGDFYAIKDISFEVPKGEVVGLLGPNGAGKSTTMKILSGFMPSSEGQATVAGFDVRDEPLEVKKRVGYLPEDPPLYVEMRIREYLEYVAKLKNVPKEKIKERVDYVGEHCGLISRFPQVIGTLSKGFRQRVGIAQALVHDPEVIILDEPTVGLDPVQIVEIRNLIKSLAGGHTVILSTHILPEVSITCSSAIMINRGQVLAKGNLDSFVGSSKETLEQSYINLITKGEAPQATQ